MPEKYKLTPLAENDIEKIYDYTIDTWGKIQADKYTKQLYTRFQWLANNPMLGRLRDEIKTGYRSWNEDKTHTIFYRVQDSNMIEIIGIPHQNMDIEQHLSIENQFFPKIAGDELEDD